jgi:prophage maintenance system killer protein/DNA-binding MarR family transcriptional regulator
MGWMMNNIPKELAIYQASNGEIKLKEDIENETIWANQKEISDIFGVERSVVTKHIRNIYKDNEVEKNATSAKIAQVQTEGKRTVKREVEYYNLDIILAVGYRVNSKIAIEFRKWATKTLKEHILQGYTINKERIQKNYDEFLRVVEDIKVLSQNADNVRAEDVLELIKAFSATWFGLDSYDREELPKEGITKVNLEYEVEKLYDDIAIFKQELMNRGEAAEIFATEKTQRSLEGIVGNVFQSVFGEDAYPTVEEKAAHLLYFVVKNHPFNDGNKRCGAFSFIWLLKRAGFNVEKFINPNALTALTLLIAESNPNDKERMVGLVLLMLRDG